MVPIIRPVAETQFSQILEYDYLRELSVRTQSGAGTYLFTLEFGDNGFSRYPAQSKCLHAVELDSGRLTWQPNNRLTFTEAWFTAPGDASWLRRQTLAWHAET